MTHDQIRAYLQALPRSMSYTALAKEIGVSYAALYRAMREPVRRPEAAFALAKIVKWIEAREAYAAE